MGNISDKLQAMGIVLPNTPVPVGAYTPAVKVGDLVFTSGQLPMVEGRLLYQGKVGCDCTVEEAVLAARTCLLNCLSAVQSVTGDLQLIERVVKVTGYVASFQDFHQQPNVLNGASELLVELFGENGKHARSAVGVYELPLNAPVEVELVVKMYTAST